MRAPPASKTLHRSSRLWRCPRRRRPAVARAQGAWPHHRTDNLAESEEQEQASMISGRGGVVSNLVAAARRLGRRGLGMTMTRWRSTMVRAGC